MPKWKHKERRNAFAFSSARCRPFETSYISRGDCFAVVANCYGDEAVAPSIFVSISSLFSFHCLVTDVKNHQDITRGSMSIDLRNRSPAARERSARE